MLAASLGGVPFKLFALEAAKGGVLPLLLLAPLLRIPRFASVAILSGIVSEYLSNWMSVRQRLALLGMLWVAFYAFYWSAMSG